MKQKQIKKVLMCKPLHFAELDYVINPWMKPGTIDNNKAMEQWNNLVNIYKDLGIKVEIIDKEHVVPDMVFATDQGIVYDHKVLLSRFWYDERKSESQYFDVWFSNNGYKVEYLPLGAYFEGNGDAFFIKNKLLIGLGFRADMYTCDAVRTIFNVDIIPLQMNHPKFYHLDVGFLPLNDETAFYYPQAFDKRSREALKMLLPNLIEFTKEEVNGFSANSIVTGNTVIHQTGNPTFKAKLKDLGYNSIETDVSEFIKSGGGIHCLTNILEAKHE